ncbi:MAG TPA: dethiobiotin synthase [Candidatus Angelobacter sp.]|nr:dethiobiotin synthase [Candidatus Angelobacter sp.]
MARGFFVTGTDTNVGKTVLCSLLCAALPGIYWKPIQTGASEGTDRQTVLSCAGMEEAGCCPETYIFDDPVSPHLAAQRERREIVLERIAIPNTGSTRPLIVEGAGGVLAPINREQFMTDLMCHLGLPVILAARSTLGTINHSLLSLRCLRGAGLQVHGVVLIGPEDRDNREAIEQYGKIRVIGQIPVLQKIGRQSLLKTYSSHFMQEAFT